MSKRARNGCSPSCVVDENRRLARALLKSCAALCSLGLSACASVEYVDSNDVDHVIGFVDIAQPIARSPAHGATSSAAVTVTTIGAAIYQRPGNSGIAIGYNQETTVALPLAGGCIDLQPKDVCTSRSTSSSASIQEGRQQ